jgi:hypothetical protein
LTTAPYLTDPLTEKVARRCEVMECPVQPGVMPPALIVAVAAGDFR